MTLAGKKLQTIYDNGTEALADIENKTLANLDKVGKAEDEKRNREMTSDSQRLEERARELEAELNVAMDRTISKLEELKAEHVEKSNLHAEKLQEELKGAGESIKTALQQLIDGMSEQLTDVQQELCYEYDAEFEGSVVSLENQSFESNKNIRTHSQSLVNGLQQKLDQSLWETKGSEKQIVASLYKNYMQKASAIETHFAQMLKTISESFKEHYAELEKESGQAGESVSTSAEEALTRLDQVTSELEREINSFFGEMIQSCSSELDSGLGAITRDITSSHSQATAGLIQKSQDYSSSLLTAANAARDKLKAFCQESTAGAGKEKDQFLERMDRKVEESRAQRLELEQSREDAIETIRQELVSIRDEYEATLTTLAEEAQAKVQAVTHEVERDVRAAHNRCVSKLEEDGMSARQEIELEVERLLKLIAEHKESALKEIVAAAGVDPHK
ncbi:MAG: hypothetical protein KC777_01640 [Cyanobacteria bacterium HKST-UBA02]|nr:hypothetical protein [Cyanobacteria bacterium HKST-UBA02]